MITLPLANLLIRRACADDSRTMFEWANSPDSLAASLRTSASFDWDTHLAWFAARVDNPDVILLIAERESTPVGQARAEREGTEAAVAIYVAPNQRRSGVAHRLLDYLGGEAARCWSGTRLIAQIRNHNRASVELFTRAGYRHVADKSDHGVFQR